MTAYYVKEYIAPTTKKIRSSIKIRNKYKEVYTILETFFAHVKYKNNSLGYLIQSMIIIKNNPRYYMYIQYLDYRLIGDCQKKIITMVTPEKKIIHEQLVFANDWIMTIDT
jgi:hypothetical protein